jgi:maltooligosyltrehalose synthase
VAAFVRSSDGQTLLIAAPIQIATLTRGALIPPTGPEVWRDNALTIPGDPSRAYRDLFTGRLVEPEADHGKGELKLAKVFEDFPVAALLSE